MTENKRFIEPNKECRVIKNTKTGETAIYYDTEDGLMFLKWLNNLSDENEQLKQENQEYKALLQDMGMLMSDDEIKNIRNEMANKFLKPLFKSNGFDVDIDCTNGFTIIPKGDDVND